MSMPAPARPTPARPAPAAAEAATPRALMVAASVARTSTSPLRARTAWPFSALSAMKALTLFSISLRARDRPTDTAKPAAPMPTATEALPVKASMMDVSLASTRTASAVMPRAPAAPSASSGPVPAMPALTMVATRFSDTAPAPDRPMPA